MESIEKHSTLRGASGIRWLDHIGIAVFDVDAALPYYVDRLGLRVVHDEIAADPGVRLCYLDVGSLFLQLVQPLRRGPVQDFLESRGEGLHHVCFAVDDIGSTLAHLDEREPARVFMGGRRRRACFLVDGPDGVLIELTETYARVPDLGAL